MKKSRLMRTFGGVVAILGAGAALLAASGMANGLDAVAPAPVHPAKSAEAPMLMAQADAMSASSDPAAPASSEPDAAASSQPDAAASSEPDAAASSQPDAAASSSQPEAAPASKPATYTAEQADRGKEVFAEDCIDCHGKDLRGGLLGGPPLRGQSFEDKYGKGSPAGVLFEVMSTTMPPNDPGRYSDETYADLMAYILKTNGYKAGAELPSEVDALYELVIEK
jgi:S-disulfanyl-L-cysteine oxidoreductase SoxD